MIILWQKRDLVQNQDLGEPSDLPADIQGLDNASLADLSWCAVEAYAGIGFVPVEVFDIPSMIADKLALLKQEFSRVVDRGYPFEIEGAEAVTQLLSIMWAKKDAINAATTPAELDAVSVTDGWA